jgi:hypothetical protein
MPRVLHGRNIVLSVQPLVFIEELIDHLAADSPVQADGRVGAT